MRLALATCEHAELPKRNLESRYAGNVASVNHLTSGRGSDYATPGSSLIFIVDAHEDLAFNALVDGRDYMRPALETRRAEEGGPVPAVNGQCMLGIPDHLAGGIGLVFATLNVIPRDAINPGEMGYWNPEGAFQQALAELGVYRRWAELSPQVRLVTQPEHLSAVLASWSGDSESKQVGLMILMEDAEPARTPEEIEWWHEQGVRLVGPAWQSNRYTADSYSEEGLTDAGRTLLESMDGLGMALDLTHMSDRACLEALDLFGGPIVASHSNPRRLVPIKRLLPDEIIRGICERDGVVGIMPANWALDPEAKTKGKEGISLDSVVDAIDVVCEIAGNALHVGIGSDFDGGFGAEQVPRELDTIADLPKLTKVLRNRGYGEDEIEAIMGGNWLNVARMVLGG